MTSLLQCKKKIIPYCFILFFLFCVINFAIASFLQTKYNATKTKEIADSEQYLQELQVNGLTGRVGRTVSDALYFSDRISVLGDDEMALDVLKQEIISFSDRKRVYDNIQLIDPSGQVLIHVSYYENGSYAKDIKALGGESKDAPYFAQAAAMSNGQVYVSKLGLFVQSGSLIKPGKPVITVSTPVFQNGRMLGVFALSYNTQYMLNEYRDIAAGSNGSIYLLNSDGYYLSNNLDRRSEFTYTTDSPENTSFITKCPIAWDRIKSAASGSFKTSEGYFIYTSVAPYNGYLDNGVRMYAGSYQLGEDDWIVVSHLSNADLKANGITTTFLGTVGYIFQKEWLLFLALFLFALLVSVLYTFNKHSKDRIRYFSEYDSMTGVMNRRAGVAMLEKSCREAMRDQKKISICFVDVNGLKQVNDRLGHDKGDELLIGVVNGIKKCIRQQDYVIRLGGDEFLIVFMRSNAADAERAWQRIVAEYSRINNAEQRPYLLSASHGIAEVCPSVKCLIDEVLSEADEKMYAEKRLIKIGLQVVRESL